MTSATKSSDQQEHDVFPSGKPIPRQDPQVNEEISLLDLLLVLAEKKRAILGTTAICAALATVVSFLLPSYYTAAITLLPPQQSSSMTSMLASQLGSAGVAALAGGTLGLKSPNDMYVAMLKSRTVEDAMVRHFGLMQEYHKRYLSETRKAFEKHTTIDGSGKDTLIHITVEDRDPQRAAELANGYVEQYRKLSENLAITEASQRRLFFERQMEQAKDNLANAEEAMERTELSTGLIQLDSQAKALIESAATLRAQIAAKEVLIQGMQTYATDQNAQLVQEQQELESLRFQLSKLGGVEDNADTGLIIPKSRVPAAGLEYIRKLRDVKYYETIFDILARQFEIAKLDEAKQGALIQIVDPAVPPDKRSFPRRGLIIIGTTIAGLFIGVLIALFLAWAQHIGDSPEVALKLNHLHRRLSLRHRRTS